MRVNKIGDGGVYSDSTLDEMSADIGAYGSATDQVGKSSTWIDVAIAEKNNEPAYSIGIHGASGHSWHIVDATLDDVRHTLDKAMSAEARFTDGGKPKRGHETAKERWLRLKAERDKALAEYEEGKGNRHFLWTLFKNADNALNSFLDAQGLGDKL